MINTSSAISAVNQQLIEREGQNVGLFVFFEWL